MPSFLGLVNGLVVLDVCSGQRLVQIQEGPLYRVKGYPITISCNVSGFKGPAEQNFEFIAYKPDRPQMELKMISTADNQYAYAVFLKRVRDGDIEIKRLTGHSVLLHIKDLRSSDTAEIECATPNTDGNYFGAYSAKTKLNGNILLIEDTLKVSYSGPQTQSLTEGDDLHLECQVSSETFQHTHLSVTWLVHDDSDAEPRPIIALDRDLTVKPGVGFEDRYRSGQISMEKVGDTTYRLQMIQVQQSDRGKIYCHATEWIQDPDRSWVKIAYKDTTACSVAIKGLSKMILSLSKDSFIVDVEAQKVDVKEGETAEIRCSVKVHNIQFHYFSMAWLKNNKEVAQVGPLGVLTVAPDYKERENDGELRAVKSSDKDYVLTIRQVRAEDQGQYRCKAWQEDRSDTGTFTRRQSQQSSEKTLTITSEDVCSGQRLVQIQEGPLYRVKGYPITISCNVSGFKGPAEQNFEFIAYKPDRPQMELKMISTADNQYAYAVFLKRVRDGDIEIKRLTGHSVLLHIKDLRSSDTAEIECATPNTDGNYFGAYSAKTKLNVIEDTLKVSYSGPQTQSLTEGDDLHLECQVSSETFQHTHLSVTWLVHGDSDAEPRPIIALDRDLTVKPGVGFEDRYRSGQISMEKVGDTTYRLQMIQVQQSDRGKIYCHATEWIQDPDRSWVKIAYKDTKACSVAIKAIEVAPDQDAFIVSVDTLSGDVEEGKTVEIRCSVEAQNIESRYFSMAWLKNNKEVAQIGPLGVLTVAPDYKERENDGELRVVKSSDKDYVLTIRQVRAEDQGQYRCKAWQEDRSDTGTFTRQQSQQSSEKTLTITTKGSGLAVVMAMENIIVTEGDALKIICTASGSSQQLSVEWHHKTTSGSSSSVISLSREGVMTDLGTQYEQRGVRTFRSTPENFALEISEAALVDSGEYTCTVSEWTMESSGNMKKAGSNSKSAAVTVNSVDSLLKVDLKSRDMRVTIGNGIELICRVRGPKVPLTVRWKFKTNSSAVQRDVMSLLHTGDIFWTEDQNNYQLKTIVNPTETNFILKVISASLQDGGLYQCEVEAFLRQIQKSSKSSYPLGVTVKKPESTLSLSIQPQSQVQVSVNTEVRIECLISEMISNTSRFAVTWQKGDQMVIGMDRDGVIKLGPVANLGQKQRIFMKMLNRQTFELTIQQTSSGDNGQYQCVAEEWLQDTHGDWFSLPEKSTTVTLTVSEEASDFTMNKTGMQRSIVEGERVDLLCSLSSGGDDNTRRYSLTWYFEDTPLLRYSHDGTLEYSKENQDRRDRLRFSRPSPSSFELFIMNAMQSDSGRYYCKAEQYLFDCKDKWELKASDQSGYTYVTVQLLGSKLHLQKKNSSHNITDCKTGFTVDCNIVSRSSVKSVFDVAWLKTEGMGGAQTSKTIFHAKLDGTVYSENRTRDMVYSRPSPTQYTLSVPNVDMSDNGEYYCQVEEWLLTPANTWRKLAEDKSGVLSVNIHTEGTTDRNAEETCPAGTILGIAIPLICFLVVVIVVLLFRSFKSKSGAKKQTDSLWVNKSPLELTTEALTAGCESS
ncbi:immunoglobulin superfamily member 3-like [Chanos chanos]|uniref:immunoglobulin superfamily member 3-like n=1 Tax=Chanos chanos TaxID=29144 RepID=UPI0011F3C0D4|nr:immunoglobulin superfamily member 3-like [Chanos chanos]